MMHIWSIFPGWDWIRIGKYCGAALLSPKDDNGNADKEIENWLLTLVIYKFVNVNSFTEFKDGIAPDYAVADNGLLSGIQLGDTADPLIAKALELITGEPGTKCTGGVLPSGLEMVNHMGENAVRGGMKRLFYF